MNENNFCDAQMEEMAEIAKEAAEEATAVEAAVEEAAPAEKAPAKKPKIWMIVLAAVGALALLAVLAGAVFFGLNAVGTKAKSYTVSDAKALKAKETVVATMGDMELTNNQLQVYYWQVANEFYNTYGYYGLVDFEQPLSQQFYDEASGTTWQMYFLETALTSWSRYAALCQYAQEQGFVMDQEMQDYVDGIPEQLDAMALTYGYATAAEMLQADMSIACDETGYMDYLHTSIYASQYLDSIYDSVAPTMEEMEAYYKANEAALNEQNIVDDGSIYVDVRHILIKPEGGTTGEDGSVTYSDEEWEACRAEAQELLDKWQQESGTEEGFANFAMQYTEDPGSMSTGGLYTDVYLGQMVAPFEDWCFDASRKYGDTGLVKSVYGYHIMYFVDSREIWVGQVSDTIIYERTMELVNEAVAKWSLDVDYKKIVLGEVAGDKGEVTE